MSEIIPFGQTANRLTDKKKPSKGKADTLKSRFGDDEYLLKWCAEWRAARAQQEKNWAEHSLAIGWGHLEDNGASLDLSPVERMEELQWHLSMAKPRTMLLARELLGMCTTILAHRQLSNECRLAEGPVLEIICNVIDSLDYQDGAMRIGPRRR